MCHHQLGSTGPVSQVLLTRAILVCAPRGPGPVLGLGLGNIGTAPLGGHSTLNTGPRVTGDNQCYQARGAKSGHLVMKCSHESSAAWSLQSTIEECTITFSVLQPSGSFMFSMSQKVTYIMSGPLELLSLIMVFSYSNLSSITQSLPQCRRRSRAFLSS